MSGHYAFREDSYMQLGNHEFAVALGRNVDGVGPVIGKLGFSGFGD